ncbi:MAG: hypothetical protein LBO05_06110 [Deltaproteobacteria bacterium]|jgi:hypothetical protein|nr:hypothetical protein [Deltaproteobacteria bacterium]
MDLTDESKNQAEPPVLPQAGGLRDPAHSAGNDNDVDDRPEITRRRRTIFGRPNDGRMTAEIVKKKFGIKIYINISLKIRPCIG